MTARVLVYAVLLILAIAIEAAGQPAQRVSCPTQHSGIDLAELYRYAKYAEAAYGEPSATVCGVLPRSRAEPLSLTAQDYRGLDLSNVHIYREARRRGERSVPVQWIGCTPTRDGSPDFVMSTHRGTGGGDSAQDLIFDVAYVPRGGRVRTDELGMVLTHTSSGEEVWAIRGTTWDEWHRIAPNLTYLFDDEPCVFEAATKLLDMRERNWTGAISIAGHSLGGSVAQYVAQHRARYPSGRTSTSFSAYSFNGFGLREPVQDLPDLHSYQVHREVAALAESVFWNRRQGGNVISYVPAWSWRRVLLYLAPAPIAVAIESVQRHRIEAVQDSICQCAQGQGRLEYNPAVNVPD